LLLGVLTRSFCVFKGRAGPFLPDTPQAVWSTKVEIIGRLASARQAVYFYVCNARGFRKDCLTPSQIRESLDSINKGTLEGLRDYAVLNLLVRTGLRVIEIARAKVEDIRQESSEAVLWVQGKCRDSKDDFVLLLNDTLKPIRAYLATRGNLPDGAPLFASISDRNAGQPLTTRSLSRIVKGRLRAVGLDSSRLTAHSLRHTAITLSIKGGASLQAAQAMARHSDPKTTMIDFHNLNRVQAGAEKFIQI